MKLSNKKYFVDQISSTKANKMTALYHYSGVGFKKAQVNLGVFRNSDSKMVGVLQWGCSFQESILLNRYVVEAIDKSEYLELNRFSMADSEGKNSESQAISLGVKWIKKNLPNIRLLVSYAGRKEGNYGYIYQATNWEYLGYFVSQGFWFVDGEERHLNTLWDRYKRHGNKEVGFTEGLCQMHSDVRKTWTKQFIYIKRLDNKLTPATTPMAYPKPSNESPIKTKEIVYKSEPYESIAKDREFVEYFYSDCQAEPLFTKATLLRRGEATRARVAKYDISGKLLETFATLQEAEDETYKYSGIRISAKENKIYKGKYFRLYFGDLQEQIEVPCLCKIEEITFYSVSEVALYLGVSKQAVSSAKLRGSKGICGKSIEWV